MKKDSKGTDLGKLKGNGGRPNGNFHLSPPIKKKPIFKAEGSSHVYQRGGFAEMIGQHPESDTWADSHMHEIATPYRGSVAARREENRIVTS